MTDKCCSDEPVTLTDAYMGWLFLGPCVCNNGHRICCLWHLPTDMCSIITANYCCIGWLIDGLTMRKLLDTHNAEVKRRKVAEKREQQQEAAEAQGGNALPVASAAHPGYYPQPHSGVYAAGPPQADYPPPPLHQQAQQWTAAPAHNYFVAHESHEAPPAAACCAPTPPVMVELQDSVRQADRIHELDSCPLPRGVDLVVDDASTAHDRICVCHDNASSCTLLFWNCDSVRPSKSSPRVLPEMMPMDPATIGDEGRRLSAKRAVAFMSPETMAAASDALEILESMSFECQIAPEWAGGPVAAMLKEMEKTLRSLRNDLQRRPSYTTHIVVIGGSADLWDTTKQMEELGCTVHHLKLDDHPHFHKQ